MKKMLGSLLVVLVLVVFATLPSFANSEKGGKKDLPPMVHIWRCTASSAYAWGVGIHRARTVAMQLALRECAARTPAYDVCSVDSCSVQ